MGCEKVIELETDFNDKRLVIDANISKHKDSLNKKAFVKLVIDPVKIYGNVPDKAITIQPKETTIYPWRLVISLE